MTAFTTPFDHHDTTAVLCFHSSTASGAQWAPLGAVLGTAYAVVAPDLYGYGDAPDWHGARPLELADEARRFDTLIAAAPAGVHLVGHSYGGAVALRAALRHPERVRSVTVYEPVLFGLLERVEPAGGALAESWAVARRVLERIAAGDRRKAAERFIDYWSGDGA
jgi:pimeloyl-ACP methyl ester carboxylesterase